MVQHHINKDMCTVSVVFPLFSTPARKMNMKRKEQISQNRILFGFYNSDFSDSYMNFSSWLDTV
jgi:hypothetical protein